MTVVGKYFESVLRLIDALYEANAGEGVVKIQGVEFHLACPEIDRNIWEPTCLLGRDPGKYEVGPPLVFPWSRNEVRTKELRRPGCLVVEAGDKLRVWGVRESDLKAPFGALDHESHCSNLLAIIELKRADGSSEISKWPWVFNRIGSVVDHATSGDFQSAYWGLASRLARYLGLESLDLGDFDDRRRPMGLEWSDVDALPIILRCAIYAFRKTDPDECAAVVFGYLMGRAEAEETILPIAQARIKHRNRMREVGSKGRNANAEKGERNRQEIRRAVEVLVSKNGNYPGETRLYEAVAAKINEALSESTIRRALQAFVEEGSLKYAASSTSAPTAKRAARK